MNNMRRKLASILACLSSFSSLTVEAGKRNIKPKSGGAKTSISLRKFGAGKYEVGKQSGVRNGKDIKTNSSRSSLVISRMP